MNEIVRFECVVQLRSRATWFFFAAFVLLLLGQTNGQVIDAQEREILFHAPLFIAESSVMMALIALLVIAPIAGDAATRDIQTRQEPLMHTTPVGRAAYFGGRFLGAFAVCTLLLLAVPLAILLAPLLHPELVPESTGTLRPLALLQSFFFLVLPNAFIATALSFALASLVRHSLGSYLGAALVFVLTALAKPFLGTTLGLWELAKLLSPAGHTPISVMVASWSPVDLNTRLVGLDGGLLGNRLLWLAIALAMLTFAYGRFRYAGDAGRMRWWQRGKVRARTADTAQSAPLVVPHAPRNFRASGRVRQTLAVARDSLREMFTRWSLLVLLLMAWQILFGLEETEFRGIPLLPTTGTVLGAFFGALLVIRVLVVTVFAGELIWRERDANMHALADTTPVPDWVRFLGKVLSLWLVVAALHALLMLAGLVIQTQRGWSDFRPDVYLQALFGLELLPTLVFALFAMSVHILANQKHVGNLLVLMLAIGTPNLAPLLGIEHPLLRPGLIPTPRHSDFNGFGPAVVPVLSFSLYWGAWTLFLALVAMRFRVRGTHAGFAERMRIARSRFTRRATGGLAAAAGVVLLIGGILFFKTNVPTDDRAEYEQRYARHRHAPQPRLTATQLHVELYPERRSADMHGTHRLENRTQRPIDTIHVATSPAVDTLVLDFDRPARATHIDDALGHRIYVLSAPLQPGDALEMRWQVRHRPRGFPVSTDVVANGSFIQPHQWMPLIGYQPHRGMPAPPEVPKLEDVAARRDPAGRERVDVEMTIGTSAEQTAIGPGVLERTWTRNGRRYFHYAAPQIGQGYAIFSAVYAVRRARWRDVDIEIVHHPAHALNVDRMLRGMQASLEQFSRRFGPYPHQSLRMIEYPGEGGAHAASDTVWYRETFALLDPDSDAQKVDLPFAVVAHEVAHLFQAVPARVEGIALLGESFAWYAAMDVIEQELGAAHLRRFLDFMRRDYLSPRARADVPLLRAADWFVAYRKGPFAMYALREYVGRERVDLAWRRMIARHRSDQPPYATSLDLYGELQAVTPDALHTLLGDLLERNTFWELKTRQATAQQMPDGTWQVRLDVDARKVAVDPQGAETNLAMNDPIEIGAYAANGRELHRALHRIRTGAQTITITVPQRPARAGIDPRHLLIDVEPGDNVIAIEN